jgi:PAS domain S-box-containing protein
VTGTAAVGYHPDAMRAPSAEDLRRIFERSPVGIYRSTADGSFVFVNPALVAMLGYATAEELCAVPVPSLYVDPDVRATLVARYRTEGVLDGVTVAWRRKDGRLLQAQLFGHVVAAAPGQPEGFDVQVIDVTALRAAEAELREQRRQSQEALVHLQAVMGQMPVFVWSTDRALRFTAIEGSVPGEDPHPAILGLELQQVLGPVAHVAVREHERALAGEHRAYELDFAGKTYACSVVPQRDDRGGIAGVVGSSVDVTLLRQVERRLQQTQRLESLGVLAGGVAHDFNNLLVAILGNAEVGLRDGAAPAVVRGALEAVRTASLRASELVSQLLAFAGRGDQPVGSVELGPLVDEMVGLVAPTRGGAVRIDLPARLPPVHADAAQVRQVVMNLVANAIDAQRDRPGEVRVGARVVDVGLEAHPLDVITAPSGRYVALFVGDDGVGMDASTRRRIFDPFFTTKPTGHGLGLPSVAGIVRGHRGGLRLFSAPGKGSVFEVLLPVAEVEVAATTPAAPAAPAVAGDVPANGLTVMVVDDEELVRETLCSMVSDLGYRAVGAAGGREAMALVAPGAPAVHAAIVDLTMPEMSGREVVEALRSRCPGMPVIMTSGYDRGHGALGEIAGFLHKPFRFDTLEAMLHQVLGAG